MPALVALLVGGRPLVEHGFHGGGPRERGSEPGGAAERQPAEREVAGREAPDVQADARRLEGRPAGDRPSRRVLDHVVVLLLPVDK